MLNVCRVDKSCAYHRQVRAHMKKLFYSQKKKCKQQQQLIDHSLAREPHTQTTENSLFDSHLVLTNYRSYSCTWCCRCRRRCTCRAFNVCYKMLQDFCAYLALHVAVARAKRETMAILCCALARRRVFFRRSVFFLCIQNAPATNTHTDIAQCFFYFFFVAIRTHVQLLK